MYTGFHTFPFFCERPAGETETGGRERGREGEGLFIQSDGLTCVE